MHRTDQKLSELKVLWNRKRGNLPIPSRAQFATQDLQPWLGNLALIHIPTCTIRLCGTNLMSRFGRDATGCNFAALDEPVAASVISYVGRALSTKLPDDCEYTCILDGYHLRFQELVLPLSDDTIDVTMILLGSYLAETRPAWQ